ncbi:hypothetical protein [Oryzihumus sp.]|jgi:hypothetical protein|uniref:hypothetical protein n=1 Tax=Oryzihumus sp. TaxID=1968903 RepID=UPI002EDB4BFA
MPLASVPQATYHDLADLIREERRHLTDVTAVLVREAYPVRSAGSVIACVLRCREELLRAGVRAGLADAAETMARRRLGLPGHS